MRVLIKDMEMPKDCGECHFCHTENFHQWCCLTDETISAVDVKRFMCPLSEELEPCEDAVSREAAVAECVKRGHDNSGYAIQNLPSVAPVVGTQMSLTKCEDAVSRQAAIDALSYMMDTDGFRDGWAVSRANVDCMLRSLPSAQPEQQWIPVDLQNNSPEENKPVLLGVRFRDDFKCFVTSRQDYNYWTGLGREINGELRWQPLPEPYQGEKNE